MANPTVVVDFVANTRQLQKGINSAGRSTSGFGSKLKGLAKTGAFAAGAAGVGAIAATLKVGIGEWTESTKVAAQTEAVLKSTGKTAGVTADQVSDLAESIMKKSGIDDEAIASGENLLLTFTNIRNEAGKGNDIFAQTTEIMADMSTALGQDTKTSAIQLGKALNDPIKGVTALQRVGVSFTKSQKDQIKALVSSGKTMDAQKLILKELNKEFGGSAEAAGKTLPGQLKIVREEFNNFAGMIVGKLVPVLQTAISWLKDHWPEISAAIQRMWDAVEPVLSALGDLFVSVVDLIDEHWGTIGPIVDAAVKVLEQAAKVIGGVIKIVAALLRGDWAGAWNAAKETVVAVVNLIKAILNLWATELRAIFSALWNGLIKVVSAAWDSMVNGVKDGIADIGKVVTGAVDTVKGWGTSIAKWIKEALVAALVGIGSAAWNVINNIGEFLTGVVDTIKKWGTNVANWIKNAVLAGLGGIGEAAWNVINNIGSFLVTVKDTIVGWGSDIGGWIKSGITSALTGLGSALSSAVKTALNAVIRLWNAIHIPGFQKKVKLPLGKSFTLGWPEISVPQIPELAKGGIVTGPTLAMVGEAGPEAILPLSGSSGAAVQVRVFIGDTELRGLVRTEVVDVNTGIARTLLAGAS